MGVVEFVALFEALLPDLLAVSDRILERFRPASDNSRGVSKRVAASRALFAAAVLVELLQPRLDAILLHSRAAKHASTVNHTAETASTHNWRLPQKMTASVPDWRLRKRP